jgi:N-acyl-D-amino-acid deacylase
MLDLVIRGGTVVDGTGSEAFTADVAVAEGVIVDVGSVSGAARRTIDADGLLVTPGFVDIHTHFDGQATWDAHLTPSCWHGVTTAILGNCGVGFAPVRTGDHQRLVELMEGVEDIPGTALYEGIRWDWETFPDYLDALARMPRAIDVGAMVPHAALRAYVMRERAHEDGTADDVDEMGRILRTALDAGALGFSTGRTAGHRDVRGRPVPGTYAATTEIEGLLQALRSAGHGVFQVVPTGIGEMQPDPPGSMDAELDWMLALGEATRVPLTFLVMESARDPDGWRSWFAAVHAANARGANLRPQVASRCFGVLMGLQSRMNPLQYSAAYAALGDLPLGARVERLRDPQLRATIIAEAQARSGPMTSLDHLHPSTFARLFPLGDRLEYEPAPADSVSAIATRTGQDPWAVMYDLFLRAEGKEFLLYPLLNYGRGSYDGLYDMMRDPVTVQGLGDGGAHCGLICDASMTTYLLTHWARDRSRGPRLPVELAISRLTSGPADPAIQGLRRDHRRRRDNRLRGRAHRCSTGCRRPASLRRPRASPGDDHHDADQSEHESDPLHRPQLLAEDDAREQHGRGGGERGNGCHDDDEASAHGEQQQGGGRDVECSRSDRELPVGSRREREPFPAQGDDHQCERDQRERRDPRREDGPQSGVRRRLRVQDQGRTEARAGVQRPHRGRVS